MCACNRFVYLCGGQKHNGYVSSQILRYDTEMDSLDLLPPMNSAREQASATLYQGCLHVLGGQTNGQSLLDSVCTKLINEYAYFISLWVIKIWWETSCTNTDSLLMFHTASFMYLSLKYCQKKIKMLNWELCSLNYFFSVWTDSIYLYNYKETTLINNDYCRLKDLTLLQCNGRLSRQCATSAVFIQ